MPELLKRKILALPTLPISAEVDNVFYEFRLQLERLGLPLTERGFRYLAKTKIKDIRSNPNLFKYICAAHKILCAFDELKKEYDFIFEPIPISLDKKTRITFLAKIFSTFNDEIILKNVKRKLRNIKKFSHQVYGGNIPEYLNEFYQAAKLALKKEDLKLDTITYANTKDEFDLQYDFVHIQEGLAIRDKFENANYTEKKRKQIAFKLLKEFLHKPDADETYGKMAKFQNTDGLVYSSIIAEATPCNLPLLLKVRNLCKKVEVENKRKEEENKRKAWKDRKKPSPFELFEGLVERKLKKFANDDKKILELQRHALLIVAQRTQAYIDYLDNKSNPNNAAWNQARNTASLFQVEVSTLAENLAAPDKELNIQITNFSKTWKDFQKGTKDFENTAFNNLVEAVTSFLRIITFGLFKPTLSHNMKLNRSISFFLQHHSPPPEQEIQKEENISSEESSPSLLN